MLHGVSRLCCVRLYEPYKETPEGSDLPRHPLAASQPQIRSPHTYIRDCHGRGQPPASETSNEASFLNTNIMYLNIFAVFTAVELMGSFGVLLLVGNA